MPRIIVPFLAGGASTQPPVVRAPDQVEEADNALLSVHRGVEKRLGFDYIAELINSATEVGYDYHWIDRDPSERYVVFFNDTEIKVFNLNDGTEAVVVYTPATKAALQSYVLDTIGNIRMITVADTTLVLNTTVNTGMDASPPNTFAQIATDFSNTMFTTATAYDNPKSFPGVSGGSATNNVYVKAHERYPFVKSNPHLEIKVLDGYYRGDTASTEVQKEGSGHIPYQRRWVDTLEQLPTGVLMVEASINLESRPFFYVRQTSLGGPLGWRVGTLSGSEYTWEQFPEPGVANCYFDAATMPVKMVRLQADSGSSDPRLVQTTYTGDGQPDPGVNGTVFFLVEQVDWKPRYNGDDETNPLPSFVGSPIADLAWHRNRLWFGSGENCVGSSAGDFFNFFLDDYTSPSDSDRIDISTSAKSVNDIFWMVPFDETMVLFCNGGNQFELRSQGDGLTPLTATLIPTTKYEVSDVAEPSVAGRQLYFVSNNDTRPTMYEYFLIDADGSATSAYRVSSHVEGYLPANFTHIEAHSEDNVVYLLSSDEPNKIYTYRYHWEGSEKLQSAWARFILDSEDSIVSIFPVDNWLYVIVKQSNADPKYYYRLLRMAIKPTSAPTGLAYVPRLDYMKRYSGSYSGLTNRTTFTLSYNDEAATVDNIRGVLSEGYNNNSGRVLTPTSVTPSSGTDTTVITFAGDYSANEVYIGRIYNFALELSEPFVRDERNFPIHKGRTLLKYMDIAHRETGYYQVELQRKDGTIWVEEFNNLTIGGSLIGPVSLETYGEFNASIHDLKGETTITIKSDSPVPVNIVSISYDAEWNRVRS